MQDRGTALPLRALSLAIFAMGMASLSIVGAVPAIAASFGISDGRAGLLVAAFALTFAVSAPLIQIAFAHYSRRTLLLAVGCLLLAAVMLAAGPSRLVLALIVLVTWALGIDLLLPAQQRKMIELRPDLRGLMLSLNSSALFLGTALGAFLASHLSGAFGLGILAPASAALALGALGLLWLPARWRSTRLAGAS